ncbi:MAG: NADP-dependent malic enzyme [Phycisphaerae bacterium]|nr:NADP-dependent malic enzyme [Phycisphaerae bacterium]
METHRGGPIDIVSRCKIESLTDLRMIYTPGVAKACLEIQKNPETAWDWTGIGNRVAIVTDGTAVLGLGDIGVVPSMPVMEGKSAIFAEFTGISAVPILIDSNDPDTIVETVCNIAPSFGAIQLEDISAPACFEIEDKLRARLNIPVFHDDQHGTATVSLAALINGLKQVGKKPQDCKCLMLGTGAAGYAITKILLDFGIKDVVLFDTGGALYDGRTAKMNPYKQKLAEISNKDKLQCEFKDAFTDMDIFIGVARPNMVTKEMIAKMNKGAIALPLSNPIGEITIQDALAAGAAIAADGRAINNALAYPALFRGALDAKATAITTAMQIAAAEKLAELAPGGELLPDILDMNVHMEVAKAVELCWLNSQK